MSFTAAALLILASGGTTQPSNNKPPETKDETDPVICESYNEPGSRIKRRKVCMRRSEWQRQHQEEKQMIDRTQVLRGMTPAG